MGSKLDLEYPILVLEETLRKEKKGDWEENRALKESIQILYEENKEHGKPRQQRCPSKDDLEYPIWVLTNRVYLEGQEDCDIKQELQEAIEILKEANREHERERQERRERLAKS